MYMKKSPGRFMPMLLTVLAVAMLYISVTAAAVLADTAYKAVKEEDGWYLTEAATGKKVTGVKGIAEFPKGSGDYYWFRDTKGQIYRKAWIKANGKRYRALNRGKLASGRVKVGSKYYYFKKTTHYILENVWKKVNGGYCRFGAKGIQMLGFGTVKGYTYYFDPDNYGIRATGWKTVSGKKYYFNARGRMQKGFLKLDGKTYFLNNQGEMVTGWMSDGSRKYYFNKTTGAMYTGKKTIDGRTYDFGTKGYIEESGTWSIRVNKSTNVVTIYRGSTPTKACLCSVGLNDATPSGTFSLQAPKTNWHPLFGGVYGQYCRTITGNILFHSVYYNTYRNIHTLATGEYVKLGQAASHGCVRLSAGDAYYIWTNVPTGTKVSIGYFGNTDPLPRPKLTPLNGKDYDPTDPILTD